MEKIEIETEYIRLDQLLKYSGIVQTGGNSKILIQEGSVKVNGNIVTERGKKIRKGDIVTMEGDIEFLVV